VILSISSGNWGVCNSCLGRDRYLGYLKRHHGGQEGGDGVRGEKRYRGYGVLRPLCVFRCSSVVVVEGACVKDCRQIGVCKVGIVN
jgi:hypothetical protein